MSAPACSDCGAEMQHIVGKWRCPWASLERWERGKRLGVPVVTCEWPLKEPRQINGLPNGVIGSE